MQKLNVLIVDDEIGMRTGVARVLKATQMNIKEFDMDIGFNAIIAESGEEALARLRSEPVDLMLLDYKLPELSGLDIMDKLNDEEIDVLTVMVTAYASLEVAISATKNGAFDFLAKPFTPDELKSVVRKASVHLLANRRARTLERERHRVRFEFISVLAHELKTPLAAVEGYLMLMRDQGAGEDLRNYEYVIERSLVRVKGMRRLIVDLLDMTRIESGEMKRRMEMVDVVSIAKNAMEDLYTTAEKRGVSVALNTPGPLFFYADADELAVIFSNLVSNGIKYNRDDGRVDISIRLEDMNLIIEVSDTGIGISPNDQALLFKEFVRIRNKKTEGLTGTGLGLSILKKLTRLYDGEVTVKSKPGVGTTFTVTLAPRISNNGA